MKPNPSQDILSHVRSRNRCLERLIRASEEFGESPVDALIPSEETARDSLAHYEDIRGGILRAAELFDRKIQEAIHALSKKDLSGDLTEELSRLLDEERRLMVLVIQSDEKAFSKIREAQTRIQKLVIEGRKSRENLRKFKSSWMTDSGEEVDTTL